MIRPPHFLNPPNFRVPDIEPSAYPYGSEHEDEMRWRGWNPQAAEDAPERLNAIAIHAAYDTMKEMTVLAWQEAEAKTATFKRWFAEADAENVKNVLGQIVDMSDPAAPKMQPRMSDRVLERDDSADLCTRRGEDANGYTDPPSGKHHVCPAGLAKPNLATMVCADLGTRFRRGETNRFSSKKIRSLAGILLHEAV